MIRQNHVSRAFTLVELVVAVAVCSIAVMGIVRLFFGEMVGFTNNWIDLRGMVLGQDMLETIRAFRWDESGSAGNATPSVVLGLDGAEVVGNEDDIDDFKNFSDTPQPGFTRTVTVDYVNVDGLGQVMVSAGETNFKRVQVQVVHSSRPTSLKVSLILANTQS